MSTITSSSNCQWQEFCGIDEVLMLLSQFPATLRLRCLAGIRAAVAGGQNYTPSTALSASFFCYSLMVRSARFAGGRLYQRENCYSDRRPLLIVTTELTLARFSGGCARSVNCPPEPSPQAAVKAVVRTRHSFVPGHIRQ